jgi:hypothetical protein
MARALARLTASNLANPVLDLWTVVEDQVAAPFSVEFQIFDVADDTKFANPVQVYPLSGRQAVDLDADALAAGHYVAAWTPGAGEALGRHRIVWTVQATASAAEVTYSSEFDVLSAGLALRAPAYALLSDLRDEGVTSTMLSDRRALALITQMSRQVEVWTGRFFEPRWRAIALDGDGGASQFARDPIIFLGSASVGGELIEAEAYRVFNRHIRQGLTAPDDRAVPRVTFDQALRRLLVDSSSRIYGGQSTWPAGVQNVALEGLFGFTDPDPTSPVGITPPLLTRAVLMLVVRNSAQLGDLDARSDALNASRITEIRTRDQSVKYGIGKADTFGAGEFSGDHEIDDIVATYRAPLVVGAV